MTKQEAIENGFVYEGRMGIVPVYLTDLNAFGHKLPGYAGKNVAWDIVLDIQLFLNDLITTAINIVRPGTCQEINIGFGARLDGKPITEEELD